MGRSGGRCERGDADCGTFAHLEGGKRWKTTWKGTSLGKVVAVKNQGRAATTQSELKRRSKASKCEATKVYAGGQACARSL
jgi:hypothetical protein